MSVDELMGCRHVSTGLIDEGQVEGDFLPQVHLIVGDPLQWGVGVGAGGQSLTCSTQDLNL